MRKRNELANPKFVQSCDPTYIQCISQKKSWEEAENRVANVKSLGTNQYIFLETALAIRISN